MSPVHLVCLMCAPSFDALAYSLTKDRMAGQNAVLANGVLSWVSSLFACAIVSGTGFLLPLRASGFRIHEHVNTYRLRGITPASFRG